MKFTAALCVYNAPHPLASSRKKTEDNGNDNGKRGGMKNGTKEGAGKLAPVEKCFAFHVQLPPMVTCMTSLSTCGISYG